MKYKVLVADDEYIIRRGIVKLLHKYEELEVVAEAEDGEQALEQAGKEDISIFFVDINMPFVNGLQFTSQLKVLRPNAIVIIITGYDKFEYVRQALRLGVFEYILKPLNEKTFHETILNVLATLDKKSEEEKYLHWARETLDKNKTNYIGEFLDKCLLQTYTGDKFKEEIDFIGLEIQDTYTISMIDLARIENPDIRKQWSDRLLYSSAENIAKEAYLELAPLEIGKNTKGYLIIISKATTKTELEVLNQEFKNTIEKYLPVKVLQVQQTERDYYRLPSIYRELQNKLEEIKSYPSLVKKIKQYIENNYFQDDLSLNSAADYANLSPQHLSRVFKKEMDITFIDFLTNVRIEKAIELFDDDAIKMYEIAEKIGYSSQHYFSSVFKKVIGVSPVEYRNQIKNKTRDSVNY